MKIADIESRLKEDFPQHKIEVEDRSDPKKKEDFRRINLKINDVPHMISLRKTVDIVVDQIQKFHGVGKTEVEDIIYDAVKFEVKLYLKEIEI